MITELPRLSPAGISVRRVPRVGSAYDSMCAEEAASSSLGWRMASLNGLYRDRETELAMEVKFDGFLGCEPAIIQAWTLRACFSAGAAIQRQITGRPIVNWRQRPDAPDPSGLDLVPLFAEPDSNASRFIDEHNLRSGMAWLRSSALGYFSGAGIEIGLLASEEQEEDMLYMKVYCDLPARDFRRLRHSFLDTMVEAGYSELYKRISVFQRSTDTSGWKTVSFYGTFSNR